MRSWEREGERVRGRRGRRRRGVLVSILSEPRISEFEFVPLSADSIVIAYLRSGWGQAISTYFMRRDPRRGRHACIHVFSRVSVTRNLPSLDVYRRQGIVYTSLLCFFHRLGARCDTGLLPPPQPQFRWRLLPPPLIPLFSHRYLAPSVSISFHLSEVYKLGVLFRRECQLSITFELLSKDKRKDNRKEGIFGTVIRFATFDIKCVLSLGETSYAYNFAAVVLSLMDLLLKRNFKRTLID